MAEQKIKVSHTTLHRSIIRFVPEYERRWNRRAKPATLSCRVDESYIKFHPKLSYQYRAVDKYGKAVESLLRADRGIAAAQTIFRRALALNLPKWPRKITLDGHRPNHVGLRLLRRKDPKWKYILVRTNRQLNNIVAQDYRAIKRRCRSILGFESFQTAAVTLSGIELAHRIRRRQFRYGPGRWDSWSLKQQWDRALADRHSRVCRQPSLQASANALEPVGWSSRPIAYPAGAPAIALNSDGRRKVFAMGSEGTLWHIWEVIRGGGWGPWASFGGSIVGAQTVASNADGRLEVFATTRAGALRHV